MSTCQHCERSAVELWHGFSADCDGCKARALARSPEHDESRRRRVLMPAYRAALVRVGVAHEAVKAAWAADAMNKGAR